MEVLRTYIHDTCGPDFIFNTHAGSLLPKGAAAINSTSSSPWQGRPSAADVGGAAFDRAYTHTSTCRQTTNHRTPEARASIDGRVSRNDGRTGAGGRPTVGAPCPRVKKTTLHAHQSHDEKYEVQHRKPKETKGKTSSALWTAATPSFARLASNDPAASGFPDETAGNAMELSWSKAKEERALSHPVEASIKTHEEVYNSGSHAPLHPAYSCRHTCTGLYTTHVATVSQLAACHSRAGTIKGRDNQGPGQSRARSTPP